MKKSSCSVREAHAYNAVAAARRMGHPIATIRKLVKRWERIVIACKAKGVFR